MSEMTVIYNADCPICSREIAVYRQEADGARLPIGFTALSDADLANFGLTPETAAQRLHVVEDGTLHGGLDAFLVLWRALPRWRWLARLLTLPVLRPLAAAAYDHLAAPLLYALHRRRQRRAA